MHVGRGTNEAGIYYESLVGNLINRTVGKGNLTRLCSVLYMETEKLPKAVSSPFSAFMV